MVARTGGAEADRAASFIRDQRVAFGGADIDAEVVACHPRTFREQES